MKKLTKVLMLFVVALLATTPVANAVVLTPTADGTIAENYPTSDYTAGKTLQIMSYPNYNRHSLVKFDIAGSGLTVADVVDVKLRLYVNSFYVSGGGAGNSTTQVRAGTLDFDEAANYPTWATHNLAYSSSTYGQVDFLGLTNGGPEAAGWRDIDIDPALVKGWVDGSIANYGFHLWSNNYWRHLAPKFSSKEGANAPELVITPEPATMVLLSLGSLGLLRRKKA